MPKRIKDRVACPKCGSNTYLFGHPLNEPRIQKYQCRNSTCRRQFVPGREHIRKYPTMTCPKCAGRMSIFKFLSDGYRLRCNNYMSLYTILQILSVTSFEKMSLYQVLTQNDYKNINQQDHNQLQLFTF